MCGCPCSSVPRQRGAGRWRSHLLVVTGCGLFSGYLRIACYHLSILRMPGMVSGFPGILLYAFSLCALFKCNGMWCGDHHGWRLVPVVIEMGLKVIASGSKGWRQHYSAVYGHS